MISKTNADSLTLLAQSRLKEFSATVIDLLFPPHCVACQRYGSWLCAECVAAVQAITPPVCRFCGLPLQIPAHSQVLSSSSGALAGVGHRRSTNSICSKCRRTPPDLDGLRAYAFLRGPLRVAIHQFKYSGLRCLSSILAELMSRGWSVLRPDHGVVTVIVPVPLHRTRERERGYNQAGLLADELALRLGLPVVKEVLVRKKATVPQVGLSSEERWANVRDAFACVGNSLAGTRVLLIDDVYTTGSTMEAAAAALHECGVLSVWAYALARAG